jgi:hypothetical protein
MRPIGALKRLLAQRGDLKLTDFLGQITSARRGRRAGFTTRTRRGLNSSLIRVRVYMAEADAPPIEVLPPATSRVVNNPKVRLNARGVPIVDVRARVPITIGAWCVGEVGIASRQPSQKA